MVKRGGFCVHPLAVVADQGSRRALAGDPSSRAVLPPADRLQRGRLSGLYLGRGCAGLCLKGRETPPNHDGDDWFWPTGNYWSCPEWMLRALATFTSRLLVARPAPEFLSRIRSAPAAT
jgi:hypothetical protein